MKTQRRIEAQCEKSHVLAMLSPMVGGLAEAMKKIARFAAQFHPQVSNRIFHMDFFFVFGAVPDQKDDVPKYVPKWPPEIEH